MSRGAEIELNWPDAPRTFRLRIGELRKLQERCDAGPKKVLDRLLDGSWLVEDIRETIRLGLMGGGAKPDEAVKLLADYVDERPLMDSVIWAQAILMAAIVGPPDEMFDDDNKSKDEPPAGKEGTMEAGSDSSTSTGKEPSSDTPPPQSMN